VGIVTGREALRMLVGFAGVGRMGQPVCANLVRPVTWSRPGTCWLSLRAWWRGGGRGGAAPAEVAAEAEVLITMLPGTRELHDVMLVPGRALASLPRQPPGSI
jgi:3-hydroxyisobutyrate dehydrogenase-like beta-hydroxyacid dehydrogenase